eukprot:TRINITY_DN92094_c0_g1_i1.p1 TRINITY_DN92094_c0_g1~~TRINITY_DN92094_c0_g1_i1.p1  ORF type:complete len:182 (+),score=51.01 TRINITY_DN92094_c0_g1_i1:334-879(+)
MWASKQRPWVLALVDEAKRRAESAAAAALELSRSTRRDDSGALQAARAPPLLVASDEYLGLEDLEQKVAYATIVALVNAKVTDFVPFFNELLKAGGNKIVVPGFEQATLRLRKIRRLAAAMTQLKGPSCGSLDLSDFAWLNDLRGEEDVYSTMRYLLPEMEQLVEEFLEMQAQSETAPVWR